MKLAKASNSSAPGPYLGYSQQQVRLLYHLLTCPTGGCHVSLEYLDDVAIHYPDGRLFLEQDKSATATNPLADSSKELWKSIAHWIELVESNQIQLDCCKFNLYVTPARSGAWASLLSKATTEDELEPLLKKAKLLVERKARLACAANLAKFLSMDSSTRLEFVRRLSIVSCDESPLDPVRELLGATLTPELVDEICAVGLGMAVNRAEDLMRAGGPALIDAEPFKISFRAAVRKSNMPGYLPDLVGTPSSSTVNSALLARPVFIQQLDLIQADKDERLRAVADYLQTSANKVNWAACGLIHDSSFDEFDDTLTRHHGLVSRELAVTHAGQPDVAVGRLRYLRCSQFQASLEGHEVPSSFVPGCYHNLADAYCLGWHPDYEKKLGGDS